MIEPAADSLRSSAPVRPMTVGILGCGIVGTGVVTRLLGQGRVLEYAPVTVGPVLVRDLSRARHETVRERLTTDPAAILDDPRIDVVVETIGGIDDAYDFVIAALRRGKHVVTANKALVATHGPELSRLAWDRHAAFRYEAAVAGAVPVVRNIEDVLAAEPILSIDGVVNGTSNYIIGRMRAGADFATALREAQDAGFAEADPSFDVDGIDAAQKLAILISLAFRQQVDYAQIRRTSLRELEPSLFVRGADAGYTIVPLAHARLVDGAVEAFVSPAFVPQHHLFATLKGPENAVRIVGSYSGELRFSGPGAGRDATASAILADLAEIGHRFQRWLPQAIAPVDFPAVAVVEPELERFAGLPLLST